MEHEWMQDIMNGETYIWTVTEHDITFLKKVGEKQNHIKLHF